MLGELVELYGLVTTIGLRTVDCSLRTNLLVRDQDTQQLLPVTAVLGILASSKLSESS